MSSCRSRLISPVSALMTVMCRSWMRMMAECVYHQAPDSGPGLAYLYQQGVDALGAVDATSCGPREDVTQMRIIAIARGGRASGRSTDADLTP